MRTSNLFRSIRVSIRISISLTIRICSCSEIYSDSFAFSAFKSFKIQIFLSIFSIHFLYLSRSIIVYKFAWSTGLSDRNLPEVTMASAYRPIEENRSINLFRRLKNLKEWKTFAFQPSRWQSSSFNRDHKRSQGSPSDGFRSLKSRFWVWKFGITEHTIPNTIPNSIFQPNLLKTSVEKRPFRQLHGGRQSSL